MSLFPPASDQPEIEAVVRRYIDGYLGQEASLLRRAFHADAKLMAVEEGTVGATATGAWFDRIEAKRRSGGGTLAADSLVLGIDRVKDAAVAKVRLTFKTHEFHDYLSLLKTADGWIIVNKIYV